MGRDRGGLDDDDRAQTRWLAELEGRDPARAVRSAERRGRDFLPSGHWNDPANDRGGSPGRPVEIVEHEAPPMTPLERARDELARIIVAAHRDGGVSLKALARHLRLSPSTVHGIYHKAAGERRSRAG